MTKVLPRLRRMGFPTWCRTVRCRLASCLFASCLLATGAWAQPVPAGPHCPQTTSDLYSRIRTVGLDPARVYHVRDASIHRPNLTLTFDDGTLAFTEDICGRTTGAFFEGEGEILLRPPTPVERGSMSLFTGTAILEEQFISGYLRFNDDTAELLRPFLSPAPDASSGFMQLWGDVASRLAEYDALRLLLDFSHFLPPSSADAPVHSFLPLLHAHLIGRKFGGFEVFWDGVSAEPVWAGQERVRDGVVFFNIWTSFSPIMAAGAAPAPHENDVTLSNFRIRVSVHPPTHLQASTDVDVHVRNGGARTVIFELSQYLKVDSVVLNGRPADFIQNPAIPGSERQRNGNDLVAVVFPADLKSGQDLELRFTYAGDVLSDAGDGLLYVGARGNWYPSLGPHPSSFDMEFRYPAAWTLLATGKKISPSGGEASAEGEAGTEKVAHWVSERPILLAGFNLGRYVRAEAKAGSVLVEAYSTKGVERTFPKAPTEILQSPDFRELHAAGRSPSPVVVTPPPPSPARDVQAVADSAAKAIGSFSKWFGPYPFSSLALTQMPGDLSQGWPSLVFLSSFAFLSPQEQADLHLDAVMRALDSQVLVHETAHQWWGDLVYWRSYHDQWLMEGLANYSSLLLLEQHNPAQFRQVMEKYRNDLLSKNKDGEPLRDAGPVTLGSRLTSSHFPAGYDAIAYERGTWLLHMLRMMLRHSDPVARSRKGSADPDEPFFRALRKARERYAGKSMSTQELIHIFEEELPRPLWYENRHKLDWFVDGWINGTAIPELSTRDVHVTEKAGATIVSGQIVQKGAPDDLVTAVPVYAETTANSMVFLGEVLADGHETSFRLSVPTNFRKIVLDPKQTVLTAPK